MSVFSIRNVTYLLPLGLMFLAGCSSSSVDRASNAEFYWSAAKETYAAGDYRKTADHLETLISSKNDYTVRALPWYLVLTSGMASGYMELADQYAAGARAHKEHAAAFHTKTIEYRETASRLALRFAQNVDKLDQLPFGRLPLAFDLPKGSAAEPSLLAKIASGVELNAADAADAEALAVQHSVLMTACLAAGSPNDVAKAEVILGHDSAGTERAAFGQTIAYMLETESALYSRNKLDQPDKLDVLQKRAAIVRAEAARLGSARVVLGSVSQPVR